MISGTSRSSSEFEYDEDIHDKKCQRVGESSNDFKEKQPFDEDTNEEEPGQEPSDSDWETFDEESSESDPNEEPEIVEVDEEPEIVEVDEEPEIDEAERSRRKRLWEFNEFVKECVYYMNKYLGFSMFKHDGSTYAKVVPFSLLGLSFVSLNEMLDAMKMTNDPKTEDLDETETESPECSRVRILWEMLINVMSFQGIKNTEGVDKEDINGVILVGIMHHRGADSASLIASIAVNLSRFVDGSCLNPIYLLGDSAKNNIGMNQYISCDNLNFGDTLRFRNTVEFEQRQTPFCTEQDLEALISRIFPCSDVT
ncbi:hypothetical protein PCE1_004451 [Barthelona sp. PCE]